MYNIRQHLFDIYKAKEDFNAECLEEIINLFTKYDLGVDEYTQQHIDFLTIRISELHEDRDNAEGFIRKSTLHSKIIMYNNVLTLISKEVV